MPTFRFEVKRSLVERRRVDELAWLNIEAADAAAADRLAGRLVEQSQFDPVGHPGEDPGDGGVFAWVEDDRTVLGVALEFPPRLDCSWELDADDPDAAPDFVIPAGGEHESPYLLGVGDLTAEQRSALAEVLVASPAAAIREPDPASHARWSVAIVEGASAEAFDREIDFLVRLRDELANPEPESPEPPTDAD